MSETSSENPAAAPTGSTDTAVRPRFIPPPASVQPGRTTRSGGSGQTAGSGLRRRGRVEVAILTGAAMIAASILVGLLLLAILVRHPAVESDAYKDGYGDGNNSSVVTSASDCGNSPVTVGDRAATRQETKDYTAGCKDGFADQ